jgi:hypothetical protein
MPRFVIRILRRVVNAARSSRRLRRNALLARLATHD